ncbi:MAG TPA: tRNA preQ1(34) S-adenosylmethionine ribosyltransferase-isomerase QueA [Polyangiaceae bacterium]|nr:tRNA preQ1(34) S-adenosylmethionine ribosyltransferase-isomerase QueA [Polyangiaceae bacterium]
MRTDLFDYSLPVEHIAQRPAAERDGARLLVLDRGTLGHRWIKDWAEMVPEGALVVLNDSRVIKARLHCQRVGGGGKVELLLLERETTEGEGQGETWLALGKANRPLREGTVLGVGAGQATVIGRGEAGVLRMRIEHPGGVQTLLHTFGKVPLPPYVERPAESFDEDRYQTVFAAHDGSVAAPTAGLHLTAPMMERLRERGVTIGAVTLHVGVGTFRPVAVDDLDEHPMHTELFSVSAELAQQVNAAKRAGSPVVAVGTTVVRALESAAAEGELQAGSRRTRLLIQPGYCFKVVNALLTNFHAPRSTLLALVSAFAGTAAVRAAYQAALSSGYRFLSYGDAMWLPAPSSEERSEALS